MANRVLGVDVAAQTAKGVEPGGAAAGEVVFCLEEIVAVIKHPT